MAFTRNSKLILALALVLLLGIFLPPNINGTRFRDRLAPALSAVLGRQVKIGQVKYRLLPRPGFDLYDFRVADDPAFSAEPLLMCGKVTADLRLTSLWHGRLEIANLKLTDDGAPPSLNLVHANGHWNVEALLLRVGQVPSAPTAKRSAEQRSRFPYIQATAGRINLKLGAEKTPFALTNTDFAFWLAAEDVWHLRLQGRPVRTDMNLNETGSVKLEGDLRRSPELADMPVKLQLTWEKAQVGQVSSLLAGLDRGWRGGLSGEAQLAGTLGNLHITGTTDLSHFRRDDITRDNMPQLRTRCLGAFVRATLDLKCDTPLETGGLLLTGRWSAATPRDYDLSIVADHVPLSMVVALARHARRSLPDDLTATGNVNAAFGFHARNGVRNWHGAGMTSPFLLETTVAEKPFPVSPVKFHIGMAETSAALTAKRARLSAPQNPPQQPDSLTIDPFSVQVGPSTALEVQGYMDGVGYRITAKGLVPLERLLLLGKAAGFPSELSNFNASAMVDLNVSGAWANFAPARLRGSAHVQNLAAWISGVKDRLVLSQADAQLTDTGFSLNNISGQFEHSAVAFEGTVIRAWVCPAAPCPFEFDLHTGSLAVADVAGLLGSAGKTWNLPFLSESSSELPAFRAHGTLSADHLVIANLPLEKFTSSLELGDRDLRASHVAAKLAGGTLEGEWRSDWTGSSTRYTASGKLSGVMLDQLAVPSGPPSLELLAAWVTGKADVSYSLRCEGKNEQDLTVSAAGQMEFSVANGSSRSLQLEAAKPLKFQSLQGNLQLEKQVLKVLPSKFRAERRIYEVSGTVNLADQRARLKVSNGGSQWDVTGAVENPQISPEPMTAQSSTVHSR
jgi:AsmA-like C-terminal region/AsmA family